MMHYASLGVSKAHEFLSIFMLYIAITVGKINSFIFISASLRWRIENSIALLKKKTNTVGEEETDNRSAIQYIINERFGWNSPVFL